MAKLRLQRRFTACTECVFYRETSLTVVEPALRRLCIRKPGGVVLPALQNGCGYGTRTKPDAEVTPLRAVESVLDRKNIYSRLPIERDDESEPACEHGWHRRCPSGCPDASPCPDCEPTAYCERCEAEVRAVPLDTSRKMHTQFVVAKPGGYLDDGTGANLRCAECGVSSQERVLRTDKGRLLCDDCVVKGAPPVSEGSEAKTEGAPVPGLKCEQCGTTSVHDAVGNVDGKILCKECTP